MLASLDIKNVALIDSLQINFGSNLNVISGETGSGKSIMLNALGFVIGDRLDKTMVRANTDFMKVDAFFVAIPDSCKCKIEKEFGIEIENNEILISREFNLNGKTYCKVNGELVTTAILKKITSYLIDIHGQHEHQALLNKEYQLDILDNYCKLEIGDRLDKLNELIDEINNVNAKLHEIGGDETQKQNLIDLYSFQLIEMKNADIKENELEELTERFKEMKDSEKIALSISQGLELADKSAYGMSATEQLNQLKKIFLTLTNFGDKYARLSNRIESINIELQDLVCEINEISNNLGFDQNEYETIDARIDFIKSLFRKYGGNYNSYTEYNNQLNNKLNTLINSKELFNKLMLQKEDLLVDINNISSEISTIRKRKAIEMQERIEIELKTLGMKDAKFFIDFDRVNEMYTRNGFDAINFMFSANLGFETKPLNKVASGGELSRFMLAYKIVLNKFDEISTLIFDEIDTGISGNIANVVANCMGKLSREKQLLVVTHLPQICAMGDVNFLVEKYTDSTTHTTMQEIEKDKLLKEIARLMGLVGDDGKEFALKLKNCAIEYKRSLKND